MWFGGVHLSIPIILPQNHSCGGLPCIMGFKLALPPMAFNVPYLSLFFELVFLLFFVGTVCSFFFFFFFIMKNVT